MEFGLVIITTSTIGTGASRKAQARGHSHLRPSDPPPVTFRPLVKLLPPDPSHIDDATIARVQRDLKSPDAKIGAVDVEAPTAIDAPDIAETSKAEQPLPLGAGDRPAIVETCSYTDVHIHRLGE